jgi:hypothetical protein
VPESTCSALAEKDGGGLTFIVKGIDTEADTESITVNVS